MVKIILSIMAVVGIGVGIWVACTGGTILMAVGLGILAAVVTGMAISMASAI